MIARIFSPFPRQSFFLLGPRGTGKTSWLKDQIKTPNSIDLLESEPFNRLTIKPERLSEYILNPKQVIIIDEIQKIPALLDEVHRLLENSKRAKTPYTFILTGSSARKLKRQGSNLLAGRAITEELYPLTVRELGSAFDLRKALEFGMLPTVWSDAHPREYLQSYVKSYLKEEVQQEGLVRSLPAFARFLEAISYSQASVLNLSNVAQDCAVPRKTVEGFVEILEDTLVAKRLYTFTKRAKRAIVAHPKFYLFDVGVFRALRPRGPLDSDSEIMGAALETLVLQELLALNAYLRLQYSIHFWRTNAGDEVDFVLYGEKGLIAIEVKSSDRLRPEDTHGLELFGEDYPSAKRILVYAGTRQEKRGEIQIIPIDIFLKDLSRILNAGN